MIRRVARKVLVKGAVRTRLWPFDQLEVGECSQLTGLTPRQAHSARNSARQFGLRCQPKRRFTIFRHLRRGLVNITVERIA